MCVLKEAHRKEIQDTEELGFFPYVGRLGCMCAKSLQSCLTLSNPLDHRLPGSSVHGILQATKLEWVAVPSSRGSSQPRDRTSVSCLLRWQVGSLPLALPGKTLPRDTEISQNLS